MAASDFERLGLCNELIHAISEEGWFLPTPVQDEAIPLILGGGDVCVASETGTGKTGAFVLPCIQLVKEMIRKPNDLVCTENEEDSVEFGFDASDKDRCVIYTKNKNDNFVVQSNNNHGWFGIRANKGIIAGHFMYEVEMLTDCLVRVGWGTETGSYRVGTDAESFGYGSTGKKSWNNSFEPYGETFSRGDVIGCVLDRELQLISFTKNGSYFGTAYNLPPSLHQTALYPMICGKLFCVGCRFTTPFLVPLSNVLPVSTASSAECTMKTIKRTFVKYQEFTSKNTAQPFCVIMEPTRDLAIQTFLVVQKYLERIEPQLYVELYIGGGREGKGTTYSNKSTFNQVHFVVGTLQMITACFHNKILDFSNLRILVLDEADELMGLEDHRVAVSKIQDSIVSHRLQILLFSATLRTCRVQTAIRALAPHATWIDLKDGDKSFFTIPETVHCVIYELDPCSPPPSSMFTNKTIKPRTDQVHEHQPLLHSDEEKQSKIIKELKPQVCISIANQLKMESCMIFCRTNLDCDNLEKYFNDLGGGKKFTGEVTAGKENPYSCVVLAGSRTQAERQENLQHFKSGNVRFLICTDLGARGLDIKELPYVMMLGLPDSAELFFHRIGRVGRANAMGLAIAIVACKKEKVWYHTCPNRGKNCFNTKLVEAGGCCIWYSDNEVKLNIEKSIGFELPKMEKCTLKVDGILELEDSTAEKESKRAENVVNKKPVVIYGKEKEYKSLERVAQERLNEISTCVQELQALEENAQENFVKFLVKGIQTV